MYQSLSTSAAWYNKWKQVKQKSQHAYLNDASMCSPIPVEYKFMTFFYVLSWVFFFVQQIVKILVCWIETPIGAQQGSI